MAIYNYNTQDLYFSEYGTGEVCLLLIHGLGGNSTLWHHQIDYFQSSYRIIAVDLFGHGGSSGKVAPESAMELNAGALQGLISEAGSMPTIAVAHSLGGSVLLELLKLDPSLFKGLVFVDSTCLGLKNIINMHVDFSRRMLGWPDDQLKEKTEFFYNSLIGDNATDENRSAILAAMSQCDPRWLFEYTASCGEFYLKNSPEKLIINNSLPVLIAEAGHGVGSNFAKSWINLFRTANYYLFENSYHYFFMEKHERFNKLLDDFITGIA